MPGSGYPRLARWALIVLLTLAAAGGVAATELNPYQAGLKDVRNRDLGRAINHFNEALSLNLEPYGVHLHRGFAFFSLKNYRLAVVDFEAASRLRPQEPAPLLYSIVAMIRLHDHAGVIRGCQRLSGLQKVNPGPHNSVAWLLATSPDAAFRDGPRAVEEARVAVRLSNGKSAYILDTLAAAYAENGQFEEAVKQEAEALALSRQPGQDPRQHARDFASRLDLYRHHRPLREETSLSPNL